MPYPQPFGRGAAPGGSLLDHRGKLRFVSIAGPNTGQFTVLVPGNVLWRLISIAFETTVDAGSADGAIIKLFFLDPTDTVYFACATFSIVPIGATDVVCFSTFNSGSQPINDSVMAGDIGESAYLPQGSTIKVNYTFASIPPVFGAGLMVVEEWTV